jgi:hypothetical protein
MSDMYPKEGQPVEKVEPAPAAEAQALDKRVAQAEPAKVESQPATDASDLQAQSQKVEQFRKDFAGAKGMEGVADRASPENANKNDYNGAQHQIDVANTIGKDNIKEFEQEYVAGHESGRVDIVTKDNIAVECKHSVKEPTKYKINYAAEQAVSRTDSGQYKEAIVVYNDGVLNGNAKTEATQWENNNPKLHFCERSEINNKLKEISKGS